MSVLCLRSLHLPRLAALCLVLICFFGVNGAALPGALSDPASVKANSSLDRGLFVDSNAARGRAHFLPVAPRPDKSANTSAGAIAPTAGELDASFNANIFSEPGTVRSTALQPDGKILVGGYFRTLNDMRTDSLARLNADNTIDSSFTAQVNSTILAIVVQPDGKILIGGAFTAVNSVRRHNVARLNPDGSLDLSFDPGSGADGAVFDLALQSDGKIVLGGNFRGFNGSNNVAVARLNPDGSIDSSFRSPLPPPPPVPPGTAPQPQSIVYSLGLAPNGKIVLGGFIVRSYTPNLSFASVLRLDSDGGLDSSFNPGSFNSNASDLAVQPDGKVVVVGFFTTIGGVTVNRIARLNPDGTLDSSFNPGAGADAPVETIYLQANGQLLIGGIFRNFNAVNRKGVARLNSDGSLDATFAPTGSGFGGNTVNSVIQTAAGKVLTGAANISVFAGNNTIVVYNPDGSIDTAAGYNSTARGEVRVVVSQPDGKILVGGFFTKVNNVLRGSGLARLNPDGSTDGAFATNFATSSGSQVNAIALQPDGKILVAGRNVNLDGSFNFYNIARFNTDGTADSSFVQGNLPPNQEITRIALRPNGKIIIIYNLRADANNLSTSGVARLNSDGSVDSSFNGGSTGLSLTALAVQPDEKVLLGGPFSFCRVGSGTPSVCYSGIIRLNSDGTSDPTFRTDFSTDFNTFSRVNVLTLQPDGRILAGGNIFVGASTIAAGVVRLDPSGSIDSSFNYGSISSATDLARVEDLKLLTNGKIIVGGFFNNLNGTPLNNLARLGPTGVLDPTFAGQTDGPVDSLALQPDGKLLIGGAFETVDNVPRTVVARLLSEPGVNRRALFDFDGDGRADVWLFRPASGVWYGLRSGSNNSFFATQFGINDDKIVPADYDGDGKTDLAVFRPSTGVWYLQQSTNGFTALQFGQSGDVLAPADFDGDGRADLAVFRPSTGVWYVQRSTGGVSAVQFGQAGDLPQVGDFDGDGKADISVYRPSTGTWLCISVKMNEIFA